MHSHSHPSPSPSSSSSSFSSSPSSSPSSPSPLPRSGVTHIRKLAFWSSKPSFKAHTVVLITGAASGIGYQLSLIYSKRNARMVLIDINQSALQNAEKKCRAMGASDVLSLKIDVTKIEETDKMIEKTLEKYGRLELMILCAGIGAHHLFTPNVDLSIFNKVMAVNFYGYLHCIRSAYSALVASSGQLTAITSFSGEVGLPYRTAYCASKFAITGFLESLRAEMEYLDAEYNNNNNSNNNINNNNNNNKGGKKSFHITIVCPPSVDTNLRKNSLTNDSNLKEAPAKYSLTVEQCAAAIVDATDRKLRKAFFPFQSWMASYLRPIIPDVMDQFIMKRAKL